MKIDFELLKNPSAVYRGKPFWAWNGKIEKSEVERQIIALKKMGFGGAFIHSRTGLVTEYMGDEWLDDVKFAVKKLYEHGMEAYLYDEDRWPSGTCGGYVTEEKAFRAKYMIYKEVADDYERPENFLGLFAVKFKGDSVSDYREIDAVTERAESERVFVFYYDYMQPDSFYNGYTYADTMNKSATERFLSLTHEKYYKAFGETFGKEIKGIFTDEPHRNPYLNGFGRKEKNAEKEIPYTYSLFDEFKKRKGYDIRKRLPVLWFGKSESEFCKEAYDLIEVEQELFLENFAEPYAEWCKNHGIAVTGHVLHEDNLSAQTTMCGSVMRYYEYMDMPGMDNLTEDNFAVNVPSLVKSVAKQLGKTFVLDELYAATGWKMTFADYKRTGEWQSLGGVNLRCPHLSWYTMKGQAKRDYPASFLTQSAWYEDHDYIESYFSRLQYLLTVGEEETDTAIINPVESVWGLVNERTFINCFGTENPTLKRLEKEYYELFEYLRLNGCSVDYIDEGIFAKYGKAEDGELVVGKKKYKKIVLNGNLNLRSTTLFWLKKFVDGGGTLISAGRLPEYIDGEKHDCRKELEKAVLLGFDKEKVLNAVKKSDCEISGKDFIVEKRKYENETCYFILNRATGNNKAEIKIENDKDPVAINLTDGTLVHVDFTRNKNTVSVKKEFARGELVALYFTDKKVEKVKKSFKETDFPTEFTYELSETNILPLQLAVCFVDGKYFLTDEVLNIDERLREKFSLGIRHGEMIQPWFKNKFFPKPATVCKVTLNFEFTVKNVPEIAYVMTEDEEAEISLNGISLRGEEVSQSFIDVCFKKIKIPSGVTKTGKNELTVTFDFNDGYDIEGLYLVGNFGVNENDEIIDLPKKITLGDVCEQGLKYYGARLKLFAPLENGTYKVSLPRLDSAICYFNSSVTAFLPYETEFTVNDGCLTAELAFTRQNLFGSVIKNGERTGIIPQGLPEDVKLFKIKERD